MSRPLLPYRGTSRHILCATAFIVRLSPTSGLLTCSSANRNAGIGVTLSTKSAMRLGSQNGSTWPKGNSSPAKPLNRQGKGVTLAWGGIQARLQLDLDVRYNRCNLSCILTAKHASQREHTWLQLRSCLPEHSLHHGLCHSQSDHLVSSEAAVSSRSAPAQVMLSHQPASLNFHAFMDDAVALRSDWQCHRSEGHACSAVPARTELKAWQGTSPPALGAIDKVMIYLAEPYVSLRCCKIKPPPPDPVPPARLCVRKKFACDVHASACFLIPTCLRVLYEFPSKLVCTPMGTAT